jgi:hypothetical protein
MGQQFRERIVHGPSGRVASAVLPALEIVVEELFRER